MTVLVDANDQTESGGAGSSGQNPEVFGRGPHQAPDVDGNVLITGGETVPVASLRPGDLVRCLITGSDGIDLIATAIEVVPQHTRTAPAQVSQRAGLR